MLRKIVNLALMLTLVGFLLARLQMAFVRYFDVDEFAHMHWAYLITIGKLPYRDFFYYVIPYFQWLLAPIFLIRPDATVLILARVWEYFIYAANVIFIYRLTNRMASNRHIGLLAAVIFAAFPMTFDKTVDVRPDMAMILFYLVSVDLIISVKNWTVKRAFILGLIVSADIMLLPKIIFAVPALVYLFFVHRPRPQFIHVLWVLAGGIIPAMVFFGFLTINNITLPALNMILHDSVAVNVGKIPFSPWKALSPWPLIYVSSGGPSFPWQVNTAIWIASGVGLLWFIIRRPLYGLYLGILTACGIVFLFEFPAPYTQYFLPLSVFAGIEAAFAVYLVHDLIHKILRHHAVTEFFYLIIVGVIIAGLVQSFKIQYVIRVDPGNTNDEQLGVINDLLKISKENDTVYDMVGSYVFRPDAYYFCCHPYGDFAGSVTVKPPPLKDMLVKNQTKFVILDRTGQSLWLTPEPNLYFLKTHYLPSRYAKIYTPGAKFNCKDGKCIQIDLDNQPVNGIPANILEIIIPDLYQISTNPPGRIVKLTGRAYPNGNFMLDKRFYEVVVDPDITGFTVQMYR
jgi:hypothetical protein